MIGDGRPGGGRATVQPSRLARPLGRLVAPDGAPHSPALP